jgi:hypothetical protein
VIGMNKKQATRNMVLGVVLIVVAVGMGVAAVASIQVVLSLPR